MWASASVTLSRLHITTFLALAVAVWAGFLYVRGTSISVDHLAPFGTVVGFLVILGIAFEHRLWTVRWLHGWFVKRPDLRGTWLVELKSDWRDPETGETVAPIRCYMGVRQTLSTLQMHLMTAESESWFIADRIQPSPNGDGYQIVGVYTNNPQVHLRGKRSEIHRGSLILNTHGPSARPEALTGEYWTDRKTTGRLALSDRTPRLYTRFEDAGRVFR